MFLLVGCSFCIVADAFHCFSLQYQQCQLHSCAPVLVLSGSTGRVSSRSPMLLPPVRSEKTDSAQSCRDTQWHSMLWGRRNSKTRTRTIQPSILGQPDAAHKYRCWRPPRWLTIIFSLRTTTWQVRLFILYAKRAPGLPSALQSLDLPGRGARVPATGMHASLVSNGSKGGRARTSTQQKD